MTPKLFMFFIVAWLIGMFTSAMADGQLGSFDDLNTLAQFQVLKVQALPFVPIKVPMFNTEYFGAVARMGTWNLSNMGGVMLWVRMIVYIPLTIGVGFGLVTTVAPVLISATATLISAFRILRGG